MSVTTLHTDESRLYLQFGSDFAAREAVNHAKNFFSQLKRSIDVTHHHVSRKHLPRHLAEFDFRHFTRDDSDTVRMRRLIYQAEGRRLTHRPLTEVS